MLYGNTVPSSARVKTSKNILGLFEPMTQHHKPPKTCIINKMFVRCELYVSWMKTFPAPSLHMVNNNVILPAICWTKTWGPWLTVNWAVYNHAKWPDWKMVHVVSYNTILALQCQWTFLSDLSITYHKTVGKQYHKSQVTCLWGYSIITGGTSSATNLSKSSTKPLKKYKRSLDLEQSTGKFLGTEET
jgi:hypothetical protein